MRDAARARPDAARRADRPARGRRTHAERTAETRARIVAATVACIAELGYSRTTAQEIARRAGVTWGAAQHHFGDKDGILLAVLEDSFGRFEACLADLALTRMGLEERAARFVERAWQHFASREHASTFEILLDHLRRVDSPHRREPSWQKRMFEAFDRVWRQVFGDAPISRGRHRLLQHYTVSVLSGLASSLLLEGPGARPREGELALLADTLARELSRRAS
jgi:AcrR family transcriptional regulator